MPSRRRPTAPASAADRSFARQASDADDVADLDGVAFAQHDDDIDEDGLMEADTGDDGGGGGGGVHGDEEEDDNALAEPSDPDPQGDDAAGPPPLPPHLKDISGLASWTVSSAKPGCSVPQLRAPSTALYWQSDGPQPHHLNVHFFKMVEIAGVRLYLDFDMDESYTPTKVAFLAGTGYNDLQEWCVMQFENPKGWIDVDFSGVGAEEGGARADEDSDDADEGKRWPVLRAMLVQVQIRENHQNGKDTHLRGLQIFARDKGGGGGGAAVRTAGAVMGARAGSALKARAVDDGTKKRRRTRLPEPVWDDVHTIR